MATNNKIPKCPPLRFPEFSDEWQETTLGEIGDIRMCKRIFADQTNSDRGVPFYKIGTIGKTADCYISLSLFEEYTKKYPYPMKGQILVTCAGTIGRCLIFDGVPSYFQDSNIVWIDNNQSVIANSFLFHILDNTNWSRLNTSTITRLYNDDLRNVSLALPSLAEQKKIADFLSLIDERIQSCSETIKELKTQKAGLLNQLFSQKLRFPDFTDEWTQTTLSEIAEILNSQRKPITSSDRISGDYPYYGASGIIDYVNAYIFDEELLLVGEDGAKWGKYEKTAFLVNGKYWVNNHAHVLRLPDISAYKFVESYLFFLNLKPFVTGDAPPKLTLESLKSIPIFMPSLEEQKKIADFLSLIDERIEVEEQLLKKYEEQKKYLLRHMFV